MPRPDTARSRRDNTPPTAYEEQALEAEERGNYQEAARLFDKAASVTRGSGRRQRYQDRATRLRK